MASQTDRIASMEDRVEADTKIVTLQEVLAHCGDIKEYAFQVRERVEGIRRQLCDYNGTPKKIERIPNKEAQTKGIVADLNGLVNQINNELKQTMSELDEISERIGSQ